MSVSGFLDIEQRPIARHDLCWSGRLHNHLEGPLDDIRTVKNVKVEPKEVTEGSAENEECQRDARDPNGRLNCS